ncbi:MAG TPA: hypothetical protein PK504_04090 [Ferruginibacter sp.]|nr:hypothetical protein [Ferruginibacter sp.]HRE63004.1 hypothetical protein [Ferruginibacter sp.]
MKYIFTFLMFSFSYASLYAQNDDNPKAQKIEALYVAYITKELKLTEAEAQKFWPVHTQYDNEIRAVNTNDELARQEAQLKIKKKYQDRFTKILGTERTNSFFVKDGEFRKKLVDRLRKMRQQNQGVNRPGFKQRQLNQQPF